MSVILKITDDEYKALKRLIDDTLKKWDEDTHPMSGEDENTKEISLIGNIKDKLIL